MYSAYQPAEAELWSDSLYLSGCVYEYNLHKHTQAYHHVLYIKTRQLCCFLAWSRILCAMAAPPEARLAYYQRLFPFSLLVDWLCPMSMSNRLLTHREFAFTIGKEQYLRHRSFNSKSALRKEVLRLNPSRFEIGAVYNIPVRLLLKENMGQQ